MFKNRFSGITYCIAALLIAGSCPSFASHILGGGFTYKFLGDTTISGTPHKIYLVTLQQYRDCNGLEGALKEDYDVAITIFKGTSPDTVSAKTIKLDNTETFSKSLHTISDCGWTPSLTAPSTCLSTLTFSRVYYLPVSPDGYTIVNQRCCRNNDISNIIEPGDRGITFSCFIPGDTNSANNSAVFPVYIPQAFCVNKPVSFPYAASDPDGDSLTYELTPLLTYEAERNNISPRVAFPPPFPAVPFTPGHSTTAPFGNSSTFVIDATSGRISITPVTHGTYAVGIVCKEWRNGVLINETRRELEWVVFSCPNEPTAYKPFAGKDIRAVKGSSIQLVASGAKTYSWSPANSLDYPDSCCPSLKLTNEGTFTYVLHGISDSGCSGYDTINIEIINKSELTIPNAFTPNNDGVNDYFLPKPFGNAYVTNFRVFNKWGNLMYDVHPANGRASWDGKWNDVLQPPGVYVYQIWYTDNLGVEHQVSGTITLLK